MLVASPDQLDPGCRQCAQQALAQRELRPKQKASPTCLLAGLLPQFLRPAPSAADLPQTGLVFYQSDETGAQSRLGSCSTGAVAGTPIEVVAALAPTSSTARPLTGSISKPGSKSCKQ
jgi:hypothetical protein